MGSDRVTIMGLGLFGGGAGAARYYARRGSDVTVTDLRPAEKLASSLDEIRDLGVKLVLGEHREEDFTSADIVVVNPAVPPGNEFVEKARGAGALIEREIHLVLKICRARRLRIVGVTGANGKSTTTAMIDGMLRAHDARTLCGGNIGRSVLCEVESLDAGTPVVLELSSFQLENLAEIGISPKVAVITNLTPNHLDRHGAMESYAAAKREILAYQDGASTAVLNRDDPETAAWAGAVQGRLISFGLTEETINSGDSGPLASAQVHYYATGGAGARIMEREGDEDREVCPLEALRLPGRHNRANAIAAVAAARAMGAAPEAIARGLSGFSGLPHRIEFVATVGGARYYNDSIATTPESAICALESFDGPVTLIAGGYDKGVSFASLGREIARRARVAIVMGKTAEKIAEAVSRAGTDRVELVRASDLKDAVRAAASRAGPGEVILLSPACASYDMFSNFVERGECFRRAVRELAGGGRR